MTTTKALPNCASKAQLCMAQISDEQLVDLINQLDHRHHLAFAELVERYRSTVYRRSRLYLGNHPDAEDATQIILQRVYEKLHLFRGESRFKSWINRVIDNQCANYYHTQKRHRLMHESCESLEGLDDASDHHRQLETSQSVNQVLQRMNTVHSEILRLRFYSELSLKQIAERLGISLSATKARLYRSLEKFQALYQRLVENSSGTLVYSPDT